MRNFLTQAPACHLLIVSWFLKLLYYLFCFLQAERYYSQLEKRIQHLERVTGVGAPSSQPTQVSSLTTAFGKCDILGVSI